MDSGVTLRNWLEFNSEEAERNNNNQCNDQIFNITRSSIDKVNEMIAYANEISKSVNRKSRDPSASFPNGQNWNREY